MISKRKGKHESMKYICHKWKNKRLIKDKGYINDFQNMFTGTLYMICYSLEICPLIESEKEISLIAIDMATFFD